jgi:hypothetical protein
VLRGTALLLALGVASAAAAQEPDSHFPEGVPLLHASIGTGVGLSYALIGLRGEIGVGHFRLFAATGGQLLLRDWDLVWAVGARWFILDADEGLFVAAQVTVASLSFGAGGSGSQTNTTVGGTVGWRLTRGPLFLEAAVGPAWTRESGTPDADNPFNAQPSSSTAVGFKWSSISLSNFPLDLEAGFGLHF